MKLNTIFTCEHAGNDIPEDLHHIFQDQDEIVSSHRGWDPGAWDMAYALSTAMNAPLFATFTSRLVVEANRSLDNAQLFSEFTKNLQQRQKDILLREYYFPYRTKVEAVIEHLQKPIVHLSIHTFTPVWNGVIRDVDIGLLFDPSRKNERDFCSSLQRALQLRSPDLLVKLNEPYQGIDDGFTTYLRTKFPDPDYLGIEIEINQRFHKPELLEGIKEKLFHALQSILSS